jgi:hypothetical protein
LYASLELEPGADCGWKGLIPIPETSLNILEARLEGHERELFLNFFRKMLQ